MLAPPKDTVEKSRQVKEQDRSVYEVSSMDIYATWCTIFLMIFDFVLD